MTMFMLGQVRDVMVELDRVLQSEFRNRHTEENTIRAEVFDKIIF